MDDSSVCSSGSLSCPDFRMACTLLRLGDGVKDSAFRQAASKRAAEYLSAEEPHDRRGVLTDLFRPAEEAFACPLQIFLVFRRHVLLICAILVWAAIQPRMRSNPVPSEEYLNDRPCQASLHLLLDVLIRNGVIHALHRHMVVVLDCGDFPCRQLKRC